MNDADSAAAAPGPRRLTQVFALREFRALWSAEVVSILGDQLARVAFSVLVYDRTSSAALSATVYALTFLPALLGGALLGWVADRYPRRRVMIGSDLARAALVAPTAWPGLPLPVRPRPARGRGARPRHGPPPSAPPGSLRGRPVRGGGGERRAPRRHGDAAGGARRADWRARRRRSTGTAAARARGPAAARHGSPGTGRPGGPAAPPRTAHTPRHRSGTGWSVVSAGRSRSFPLVAAA